MISTMASYSFGIYLVHPAFLDLEPRDWQEDEVRLPIGEFETTSDEFLALVNTAQYEHSASGIIDYGTDERVVAFSRVGTTSMIYGTSIPLIETLDNETAAKLQSRSDRIIPIVIGAIALGGIAAIAVYRSSAKQEEETL